MRDMKNYMRQSDHLFHRLRLYSLNGGKTMNYYIGHESQLYGVEEHRLVGGKGDGICLLQVQNGNGLEFTVSVDRGADISRLKYRGINMGYFSPCGYVAPQYYDDKGTGFLKSFTAGFLTTCGLAAVGVPCIDNGEELPLHGGINNTPADHVYWEQDEEEIRIHATIRDETIFSHKLVLHRIIHCSLRKNEILLEDKIENCGDKEYPAMVLYHMNMGYPLLSEIAELKILSQNVKPRNQHAAEGMKEWMKIIEPQSEFEEQCYFHEFTNQGVAAIFNSKINQGIKISYDAKQLPFFTEWKMMGKRDYVLGLEPGNCNPDGRDKMREEGKLIILQPEESISYNVRIGIIENMQEWKSI